MGAGEGPCIVTVDSVTHTAQSRYRWLNTSPLIFSPLHLPLPLAVSVVIVDVSCHCTYLIVLDSLRTRWLSPHTRLVSLLPLPRPPLLSAMSYQPNYAQPQPPMYNSQYSQQQYAQPYAAQPYQQQPQPGMQYQQHPQFAGAVPMRAAPAYAPQQAVPAQIGVGCTLHLPPFSSCARPHQPQPPSAPLTGPSSSLWLCACAARSNGGRGVSVWCDALQFQHVACPNCGATYPLPAGSSSWRCKTCHTMNGGGFGYTHTHAHARTHHTHDHRAALPPSSPLCAHRLHPLAPSSRPSLSPSADSCTIL